MKFDSTGKALEDSAKFWLFVKLILDLWTYDEFLTTETADGILWNFVADWWIGKHYFIISYAVSHATALMYPPQQCNIPNYKICSRLLCSYLLYEIEREVPVTKEKFNEPLKLVMIFKLKRRTIGDMEIDLRLEFETNADTLRSFWGLYLCVQVWFIWFMYAQCSWMWFMYVHCAYACVGCMCVRYRY